MDYPQLTAGAEITIDVRIPIANCRLWSPEDPFLYTLEASTGADTFETRFGMREFHFEPREGDRPARAYLNGKPYFMRGSNVTLYRFFEDPERGDLPWNERWVRLLHRRFKEMHWNSLRYCIGFPPEAWYRIADEEGFLIQDEFPIWGDETGQLDSDVLAEQYADWMRERWNHPCVVIWDAQNETHTDKTGAAYSQVRELDLSNRPWDNGYAATQVETDVCEAHPYHFGDSSMTLSRAVSDPVGMPNFNGAANPDNRHAYVINEYGWLWLNRDGTPTTLTKKLYANLAGQDAPPSQLFPLAARLLAADTEFWRCRRQAAAVLHFCALGYSRPDGQTSDHWQDCEHADVGARILSLRARRLRTRRPDGGFCSDQVVASTTPTQIPVVVINDLERPWSGPVTLRIRREGQLHAELTQECHLDSFGQAVLNFAVTWPSEPGDANWKPNCGAVTAIRYAASAIRKSSIRERWAWLFNSPSPPRRFTPRPTQPANAVDNDPGHLLVFDLRRSSLAGGGSGVHPVRSAWSASRGRPPSPRRFPSRFPWMARRGPTFIRPATAPAASARSSSRRPGRVMSASPARNAARNGAMPSANCRCSSDLAIEDRWIPVSETTLRQADTMKAIIVVLFAALVSSQPC